MNKYIVCILVGVCCITVTAQDTSVVIPAAYATSLNNYIRNWMAVKPDTATANFTTTSPLQQARMTTQYFDGLGRPVQTVIKQGAYPTGGSAADLVSSTIYDDYGRVQRQYLPFAANSTGGNTSISDGGFKSNPFQQQQWFYSNSNMASPIYGQGETYYYGKTEFEASPLNRPERSYAPGNSWVHDGKGIGYRYWVNTAADSVRIWTVTNSGSAGVFGSYSCDSLYKPGALNKKVTIDENNKQVVEFIDKEGKVVLKKVQFSSASDTGSGKGHYGWLCTYYIYDVYGLLRCVVQPRGVELLQANSWNITWNSSVILSEQCFRYEYDGRRRMVVKKVPGAGEVWMVYDQWDRLVLTQDGNMRAGNQWIFTKYDELNRPTMTGLYTNATYTTQGAMQGYLHSQGLARHESYQTGSFPLYSINQSFPVTVFNDVLTITYYDNYSWGGWYGSYSTKDNGYDTCFPSPGNSTWPYPQSLTQSSYTRGMVTGRWDKCGLLSSFYYDDQGRVIQQKHYNHSAGIDITTTQYSFSGQLLQSVIRHQKGGTYPQTHLIVTKLAYDDLGRLTTLRKSVSSNINGQAVSKPEQVIAVYEYDVPGQLKKKKLGIKPAAGTELAKLDFEYNIRGWLLNINKGYTSNANNDQYFALELGYDKNASLGAFSPQYNGNISGALWKGEGDQQRRKYDFSYDAVNRLTGADFNQYASGSGSSAVFNKNTGMDFSVSGLSYDANGNILTQKQRGWKLSGSATIDSLTYHYIANSNRLLNVSDGVNDASTMLGDFRTSGLHPAAGSKNSSTTDYSYDDNGNLVRDLNKDMVTWWNGDGIQYNHLNLPVQVSVKKDGSSNKGYIEYVYDAAGNKLRKTVFEAGVDTTVYLYLGAAVYKNDTLEFIGHEEGRIRFAPADSASCIPKPNRLLYDYIIRDHLGSVRMVLTEQKDTLCYPTASVEDSRYQSEDDFYNIDNGRRVSKAATGATQSSFEDKLYRVHGGLTNEKTGLGIVLKVMAGDKVSILAESFYTMPGGGAGSPINVAVSELLLAMTGSNALIANKGPLSVGDISGIGNNNAAIGDFIANNNPGANNAKAFVNYLLFDEQLKYISGGADPVQSGGGYKLHNHYINNPITISKTGYLYIYVSNENNLPVYFDNLSVTHTPGSIIEETHYYPFGLTMTGISSKAAGKLGNRYKFNGIEHNQDFDINMYDAFYRNLDPQIGRFWQIDPKPNMAESPYAMMGNNPILNADPLGDTLRVSGSNAVKDEFIKISNQSLGGYYKTKIGEDGTVSFEKTDKKGKMSKSQNGFYKEISSVLNQKEHVKVGLVQDDKTVIGGSYAQSKIDVSDVSKWGNNKAMSAGSVLAHEIVEQNAKQNEGLKYRPAHVKGVATERNITGFLRHPSVQENSGGRDAGGHFTGSIGLQYYRQVGAAFGKPIIENRGVIIHISEGNVTKIEEQ